MGGDLSIDGVNTFILLPGKESEALELLLNAGMIECEYCAEAAVESVARPDASDVVCICAKCLED